MWFRKPLLSSRCVLHNPSIFHVLLFYFQDVFRKYPNQYEGMISELCENLDSLDEPEARYVYTAVLLISFVVSQSLHDMDSGRVL